MVDDPNLDVGFGPAKDVPGGRLPSRLRVTIRFWMVVVMVAAGLLALMTLPLRHQMAERAVDAAFNDQRRFTERALEGPVAGLWPAKLVRGHRSDASHGPGGWRLRRRVWSEAPSEGPPYLLDLEFVGDTAHGGPSVVWVFDRGARFNDQAIRLLTGEYAKHGWRLWVVPNPASGTGSQPAAGVGASAP
jgi:hypothetical protein